MSEKFTPGPWELWDGCSWRRFGSATTGKMVVEPTIQRSDNHPDLCVSKADAALICAAPDLLAACEAAKEVAMLYERWEADVLLDDKCWNNSLPEITQELWDRLVEIQTKRNEAKAQLTAAISKAREA